MSVDASNSIISSTRPQFRTATAFVSDVLREAIAARLEAARLRRNTE